ncbi:MAG: DinB family protein, partial [Planctomycetota bacterium]
MRYSLPITTFLAFFALSTLGLADDAGQKTVPATSDTPAIPADFQDGFAKMGEAMEASAKIFEGLTAEQMNFRPSDGSHTPRWNAEHLRAAQLRFFSSIYHALDPSVKEIKEGPKQMPADYKPANPKWSGAEEAKAMREAQA